MAIITLGLLRLISTMHLQRSTPLHIYGPHDLKIIDIQLKYSETAFTYQLEFHATDL